MLSRKTKFKAIVMQKITNFISGFYRLKYHKKYRVRYVKTTHGQIRVLEFGFENNQETALYIDLHGGGFVLQSADVNTYMNLLIEKNLNVKIISIDYPKAPQAPYPIANEVSYEVIKHYLDHADEFKIDKQNIGIGGHSAGGTIAAATCIKANFDKDISFKFQMLIYPPTDLSIDPYLKPKPKKSLPPKLMQMFNDCYFESNFEIAKASALSPVFASKEELQGQAPALVITAGQDSLHDEGIRYAQLLQVNGVEVEIHDFMHSAHGFVRNRGKDSHKAHQIMIDFIRKHLK